MIQPIYVHIDDNLLPDTFNIKEINFERKSWIIGKYIDFLKCIKEKKKRDNSVI